jgi:hypothetical protein
MDIDKVLRSLKQALLSEEVKEKVERIILVIAIVSYFLHLLLILLNTLGFIGIDESFLTNPIAAIYTPFSFVLIYEVYLLVYYLPKSITIYIGKQYEIITLIVIRRIFKDIAYVDLDSDWFQNQYDLQFTYDIFTSLILFFLILLFYRNVEKRNYTAIAESGKKGVSVQKFVQLKRALAIILVPVLAGLALYTLTSWGLMTFNDYSNGVGGFKKINNVFFDQFFTVLIVVDVLLLLFSFFHSHEFHKIIRNSGFVISTILIKVSFFSDGVLNNVLIVSALLFGYLILVIHNLYERRIREEEEE